MTRFYTTCPPSSAYESRDYAANACRIARWSEETGAEGMLIYTDNSLTDPWTVAQLVLAATERLLPLVAVQAVYAPPYSIAKRIASLAQLYGRAVALNMVAGGFVKDLEALGDRTPHDERYARLAEYAALVTALLRNETVSHEGRYYALANLKLAPEMPAALLPRIFMSGSSGAGAEAAARIGAVPVNYPPPPEQIDAPFAPGSFARVGIIAREHAATAWQIAHARFPKDPRGRMTHRLATAISDSVWHKRLAELGDALEKAPESTYWLHPFQTYRTFCPYLVGSHAEVAAIIRRYQALGIEGYILDVPQTLEDLPNTVEVFRRAGGAADAGAISQERVAGGQAS